MYLIGIDISKFKHDCFIQTETGIVIKKSFSFNNSKEGFDYLLSVLSTLDHSEKIRIGLEATGHYGDNLMAFLNESGYSFMQFNPYLIKKVSDAFTLRRTKTDKLDAMTISKVLLSVEYKPYQLSSYHISSLKSLTRLRETLVKERSSHLVKLTNITDKIFPEFKPFFKGRFTTTAMYILKKYKTPKRIAKLTDDEIISLKKISRATPSSKFVKLRELAKNTIGHTDEFILIQLKSILNIYETIDNEISEIESKINTIMKEYHTNITSISGISTISAAQIIGEFGDFNKFSSASKLLAFAGLDPSTIESGTMVQNGKMVKRGSPHLRYVLMNVAMTVILNNPTFYEYYSKKHYKEGKTHRVALSHVVRKLLRIIYHLEIMDKKFDAKLLH